MPDYSKPPVFLSETELFKEWLKEKGYAAPSLDEMAARIAEFCRDGMSQGADTSTGESMGTEGVKGQ